MLTLQDKKVIYKNMELYEDNIPHMYLDSKCYVTIGIEHLLSTAADAQKLNLYNSNKIKASAAKIKTEFDTVHKQLKNLRSGIIKYSLH